MIKRLLTYIKEGNLYNAFEVYSDANEDVVSFTSYKNTKNGLELAYSNQLPLSEFDSAIVPNKKSFLVINTSNVITKIEAFVDKDDMTLLGKVFPNLKMEEFFYEITRFKNSSLISICRQSYVMECLQFFKEKGISINGFSIGVSNITTLIPFINNDTGIVLSNKEMTFKEEGILEIHSIEGSSRIQYDLQGMLLTNKDVLGFANVLAYIQNIHGNKSNFLEVNRELKEESIHSHMFSLFFKVGIGIILTLLVVNFLLFNHYYKKTESLRQTQQVNKENKSKIMDLMAIVKTKEKMIDDVISSSSSEVSYYLDALTYNLSETIILNEVIYQPLVKALKEGKEIEYQENKIIVSGISDNSKIFSGWIENLEGVDWVEKVEIVTYDYSQKETSLFSIILNLKDEE